MKTLTTKNTLTFNVWQHYAALIVTLLIVALSPVFAEQLTSGVSFSQISFTASNPPEKYSRYGQISVDYTMLYGEGYINVERYENGKAAGWVVQNLPVIHGSVLPSFSTMFELGVSGYQSSFNAYVDYSPSPLTNDSSLRGRQPLSYPLGQADYPVLAPAASTLGQSMDNSIRDFQPPAPTVGYSITVVEVKGPGTFRIIWGPNEDGTGKGIGVDVTVPKDTTPEQVAKAIAAELKMRFKKRELDITVEQEGAKVTVSGGVWIIGSNRVVSMQLN